MCSATVMKSPGRKLLITRSMIPAIALPTNVVDDNAIAALSTIPTRLRSCPRRPSLSGKLTMKTRVPISTSVKVMTWRRKRTPATSAYRFRMKTFTPKMTPMTATVANSTGTNRAIVVRMLEMSIYRPFLTSNPSRHNDQESRRVQDYDITGTSRI